MDARRIDDPYVSESLRRTVEEFQARDAQRERDAISRRLADHKKAQAVARINVDELIINEEATLKINHLKLRQVERVHGLSLLLLTGITPASLSLTIPLESVWWAPAAMSVLSLLGGARMLRFTMGNNVAPQDPVDGEKMYRLQAYRADVIRSQAKIANLFNKRTAALLEAAEDTVLRFAPDPEIA